MDMAKPYTLTIGSQVTAEEFAEVREAFAEFKLTPLYANLNAEAGESTIWASFYNGYLLRSE